MADDRLRTVGLGLLALSGAATIGMAFTTWVDQSFFVRRVVAPLYIPFFVFSGTRLGEGWVCVGGGVTVVVIAALSWLRPKVVALAALPGAATAAAVGLAINSAPADGLTGWPWAVLAVSAVGGVAVGCAWPQRGQRRLVAVGVLVVVVLAFLTGHLFHRSLLDASPPHVPSPP